MRSACVLKRGWEAVSGRVGLIKEETFTSGTFNTAPSNVTIDAVNI